MPALRSVPLGAATGRRDHRHLIPGPAVEFAAIPRFVDASPLLEEERHVGFSALGADVTDPFGVHQACAGTTLASHDVRSPPEVARASSAMTFRWDVMGIVHLALYSLQEYNDADNIPAPRRVGKVVQQRPVSVDPTTASLRPKSGSIPRATAANCGGAPGLAWSAAMSERRLQRMWGSGKLEPNTKARSLNDQTATWAFGRRR
jgi:hypothetical protein